MTHNTMTGWIEIADERHFRESAKSDRMPQSSERQHLHLGSAIFSLPGRIMEALAHRHVDHSAHHYPPAPLPAVNPRLSPRPENR
jgi:hypothetical protein